MTNQAFPSLNDFEPSWADVTITARSTGTPLLDMSDLAALKWSRKLEVGKMRGANGGRIMRRTTGQVDYEASAEIYRSGLRKLIKNLMVVAPRRGRQSRIGLVAFDILVQHTPPGDFEIYQTKIKGCRFLGDADDMKEGADPDKLELTLDPIEIVNIINGVEVALL